MTSGAASPGGRHEEGRRVDVHEGDLAPAGGAGGWDEAQMAAWVRQAAALPGWGKG